MASSSIKRQQVYLLECLNENITGSKLPSIRQVLGFFLHQQLENKKTKREASTLNVGKVSAFWLKANIPTRERKHCTSQVEKLCEEWHLLKNEKKICI